MRTTLKRGVGRTAGSNGRNGHAVFPPSAATSIARYRLEPRRRSALGLIVKILLVALLALVAVVVAVAGGAFLWFHETVRGMRAHTMDVKIAQKQLNVSLPGRPAIALLIGYDARAGAEASATSRSDTVMLVRADPVTKTITLLSIPRDLGVPIYCPGQAASLGVNRINAAYADCGSAGTVDTVKHLTGLPINYLVKVNFHGFKEIVDKLGGIWLDIDRRYFHVNDGSAAQDYANINIQPGYQLVSGEAALDFVRYRHTDDDYHRIARQQEFIRALKEQFVQKFSITQLPSLISTIEQNVEVGGNPSDTTVLSWALFLVTLPGGHFFQDRIQGVNGSSITSTSQQDLNQAWYQFTHPDVGSSATANAAAIGAKPKPKPRAAAPPVSRTSVLVLNGNGLAGAAANGAYALQQKGYPTVQPPHNILPNAPTQSYFHTQVYYDNHRPGSEAAARKLAQLFVPADVGPLPRDRRLRSLDPGALVVVVVGSVFHGQLSSGPPPPPAPVHVPPNVRYDPSVGLQLLQPLARSAGFRLEVPTVLEKTSSPDNQYGDVAARLYWIDKAQNAKAVRLVFVDGQNEYWGIQETDMANPPILADRSFQHSLKGREFSLYYSGPNLHMVVLRDGNRSYWVVNTLLDSLSNETMLAIAEGLRPLQPAE